MGFLDFIPVIGQVIDKIFPDPKAAEAAKLELLKLQISDSQFTSKIDADLKLAQLDINKIEAASPNLFVSGGRPFMIWVCGVAFSWQYVIMPITVFILNIYGHPITDLPQLDMNSMMPILGGLLGLGAMRSYERVKGAIPKGK